MRTSKSWMGLMRSEGASELGSTHGLLLRTAIAVTHHRVRRMVARHDGRRASRTAHRCLLAPPVTAVGAGPATA